MHARRWIVRLLAAVGLLVGSVAIYERWVLARLDATADPDTDGDFAFPAERTWAMPTPDGGMLHAEECGSGRPVLLLHGHGGTLGAFAWLARELAAGGSRVVAVDLRGFGRSSPVPDRFDFRGLVDDAALVLDALDLRDAIVVGHSMGGGVALGLAIERPEVVASRVRGLVLVNSTARGPADDRRNRAQVAALDWAALERLGRHPRHGLVLTRNNFGVDPRRSHVEAARIVGLESPIEPRRGFARRLLGTDLSDSLAGVDVPVLALAGTADRVVSPRESARLVQLLPDARIELFPGAGHMLPMERAELVADRILRFAAEVDGDTPPPHVGHPPALASS